VTIPAAGAGSDRLPPGRPDLGRNLTFGLQDLLGRAIVSGEYIDRAFPIEKDLATNHGVSRSVTREALKMLAAKGLLGTRPKLGTFVMPPEQWNLFDTDVLRWMLERPPSIALLRRFNELRAGVEPQAAALAALRADPQQRELIRHGLERMRAAERGEDDPLDADLSFHVAVLRATENPFFIQFRDVVATALRVSIRLTNRIAGHTARVDEHAAVYHAIVAGDAAEAAKNMRAVIDEVLLTIDQADR
jgi:DNA-binding FadR family transcriptional regulator